MSFCITSGSNLMMYKTVFDVQAYVRYLHGLLLVAVLPVDIQRTDSFSLQVLPFGFALFDGWMPVIE
jgi:hypothetical protein